jgi:hypothetical protein
VEGKRHAHHRILATELVAIEDAQQSTLKPIDQNLGPDGEPIVLADDEAALVVVKLELMHRGSFGGLGMTQSVRQPGLCHYRGFGQGSAAQYAR